MIKRIKQLLILIVFFPLSCSLSSCEKYENVDEIFEGSFQLVNNSGIPAMYSRAINITSLQWSPLSDLHRGKANYYANKIYNGIPYSSVKEIDTNVGIETSFYTFSTAVANPRSVLYTENILEDPYHGTNCSLYYGTVCSSTIEYALGIDIPYSTKMMDTLSCFTKKDINNPSNTEIGDILLSKGHVVLVTNINKDDEGYLSHIQILESNGVGSQAKMHTYSYKSFCSRWNNVGWVAYTYNDIESIEKPKCFLGSEVDKKLCPNKGDKSCYRLGEDVVINNLSNDGNFLQLCRDNVIINDVEINTNSDYVFTELQEGRYSIFLKDESLNNIDSCSFDVINCEISIETIGDTNLRVNFPQSQFFPYYIVLVDIHGNRYSLSVINDQERTNGYKIISMPQKVSYSYCKVLMKSEFGQIANIPIKLN